MNKKLLLLSTITMFMFAGCGKEKPVSIETTALENGAIILQTEETTYHSTETKEEVFSSEELTTEIEIQPTKTFCFNVDGVGFEVPVWDGHTPYVNIDGSSLIDKSLLLPKSYEYYSDLDSLGRCGECVAVIGTDIQPTEERGEIGNVRPSGWDFEGHSNNNKYPGLVDGNYIYNRCHLIGYQLTGENANEKNLVTGTRYLNIDGMLWLENEVDDYVEKTENHTYYRVIPIFEGDELVCRGLVMRAYSIEDNGAAIDYSIFVYNAQPGVTINYATGKNYLTDECSPVIIETTEGTEVHYILNTKSLKYHDSEDCSGVKSMSESNKEVYSGTKEWLVDNGYTPCGICFK